MGPRVSTFPSSGNAQPPKIGKKRCSIVVYLPDVLQQREIQDSNCVRSRFYFSLTNSSNIVCDLCRSLTEQYRLTVHGWFM